MCVCACVRAGSHLGSVARGVAQVRWRKLADAGADGGGGIEAERVVLQLRRLADLLELPAAAACAAAASARLRRGGATVIAGDEARDRARQPAAAAPAPAAEARHPSKRRHSSLEPTTEVTAARATLREGRSVQSARVEGAWVGLTHKLGQQHARPRRVIDGV